MARHKDGNWSVGDNPTFEGAQLAVLMDIRDELKSLNRHLNCPNFTGIPQTLRSIQKNTTRKRRAKKARAA